MMKKLILTTALALLTATVATVEAKDKKKDKDRDRHEHRDDRSSGRYDDRYDDDRYSSRHRTRTIYFIERDRPVARTVYIDGSGRYYRLINGRPIYIRERYYESYPSRYYHSNGSRRPGISINF